MRQLAYPVCISEALRLRPGLSRNALTTWVRNGDIHSVKIGNKVMITLENLDSFLLGHPVDGEYAPPSNPAPAPDPPPPAPQTKKIMITLGNLDRFLAGDLVQLEVINE